MTAAIFTAAVSILIGLISANALVAPATRARKRLREEAELLEHVPSDVPGREDLAEHLGRGIREYVALTSRGAPEDDTMSKWTEDRFVELTPRASLAVNLTLVVIGGLLAGIMFAIIQAG